MPRAWPGGRVGWQRQRAWMEVFSSAQTTRSPGPNGRPSQSPAYRSNTRAALTAKSGARTEIQDRCCHGLSASSVSQRRTEAAETVRWQRMASSRAISGQLHRDSGTSCSAGNAHANAMASARTAGPCTGGRPLRGRSVNDSSRSPVAVAKRLSQRVQQVWPELARVEVRHRDAFSYLEGVLADGATLKLCRLRYTGSAHTWGFAIYRASHDDYQESNFPTGLPVGTCEDALDTACGLYLRDPTAWT